MKTKYTITADKCSREHLEISIHKGDKFVASSNIVPYANGGEPNYVHFPLDSAGKTKKGLEGNFEDVFGEAYKFLTKSILKDRKNESIRGSNLRDYALDCKINKKSLPCFQKEALNKYHRKISK